MKKLYLHIGMNKTGTTSIQEFLFSNYEYLAGKGVLYPRSTCIGSAHYGASQLLGFNDGSGTLIDATSTAYRKDMAYQLDSEIKRFNAHTLIVSSEAFVLPGDVSQVVDFFSNYDVTIILYLRRHDLWLESLYNQAVKYQINPQWKTGIENYLHYLSTPPICGQVRYLDYLWLITRWAAAFGKEKIIVRPFEREQMSSGVVSDFISTVGLTSLFDAGVSELHTNKHLGYSELVMLDSINRSSIPDSLKRKIADYVTETYKCDNKPELLPPASRLDLIEKNRPSYECIARDYLDRIDGKLFYEPEPNSSDHWNAPIEPTKTDLASLIVQTMLGLFGANKVENVQ